MRVDLKPRHVDAIEEGQLACLIRENDPKRGAAHEPCGEDAEFVAEGAPYEREQIVCERIHRPGVLEVSERIPFICVWAQLVLLIHWLQGLQALAPSCQHRADFGWDHGGWDAGALLYFRGAFGRERMDPFMAVLLIIIGVGLLLHHGWKHHFEDEPSLAREESCVWVCYFQLKDVAHFETWSVICLTNAFWCVAHPGFDERRLVLAVSFFLPGVVLLFLGCIRCSQPAFGWVVQNLCNHETWILVCFTGAATMVWLL